MGGLRPARRTARKPGRPASNRDADGHGGFRHSQRQHIETPYFVEGVYNSKGERSFTASAKAYGTVMSKQTADSITDMMIGVVENGTGYEAAISGVEVAGKTGTAETNKEYNDSSFVGFAPADNPSVVVAVAIEEGVHGNDEAGLASPRAKKVLETALQVQGLL